MTPELVHDLADAGDLAVETRRLVKRYGARAALDDLELTVPEGAVYILAGANGAGKTTALEILMDLARAEHGSASVFGLDTVADGPEVRALIGYLPATTDFGYRWMSAGQLLDYQAGYFPSWDIAYAARLTETLEVSRAARFGDLSKGEARRVQLVMTLAHRPLLLLLDEPTDGLDPLSRDRVLGLLAEHLAESPTTMVVATHQVHEMEGLGDCLGVLDGGRLHAQMRRETLDTNLFEVRARVPEDWAGAPDLDAARLQRVEEGREIAWTLWGEAEDITTRLRQSGAEVTGRRRLSLDKATRVFLAMEA